MSATNSARKICELVWACLLGEQGASTSMMPFSCDLAASSAPQQMPAAGRISVPVSFARYGYGCGWDRFRWHPGLFLCWLSMIYLSKRLEGVFGTIDRIRPCVSSTNVCSLCASAPALSELVTTSSQTTMPANALRTLCGCGCGCSCGCRSCDRRFNRGT